ncbi:MAG TPA: ribonuclease III [Alphaproteobacteria bacterium]|nr:ribonuclease III [Alphaproteobacteria bacterium]
MAERRSSRLKGLEAALGHRFKRPELLEQALTHRSAVRARGPASDAYERLEFLGDRVLGLLVAELLIHRFAREQEGELTRRHTALVRRDTLVRVAREIELGEHLKLSKGEAQAGSRASPTLLADACEAVMAALFLDGGLEAARPFIERYWIPLLEADATPPRDAKTALQEWAQSRKLPLPTYRVVASEGPSHKPMFTIEVSVEGLAPAEAKGHSKRAAEQEAAQALLQRALAPETARG